MIAKILDIDKKVVSRINGFGGRTGNRFFRFVDVLGTEKFWIPVMIVYLFFDFRMFGLVGISYLFGVITILPLKQSVNRKRPFQSFPEEVSVIGRIPKSPSFPSQHGYIAVSQGLAFILYYDHPFITIFFIVLGTLLCLSRLQLGVHYPSDVMIGMVLGMVGYAVAFLLVRMILG